MTRFPNPFALQNESGSFPAVFLVEHARNTIPAEMNNLGLAPEYLQEHIAWDIGIEGVARAISDTLDIPSAYCLYSRLIVDANRPVDHPQLFWPESDGIPVLAMHSCTPALHGGEFRPWEVGMSTYANDNLMHWIAGLLRAEGLNPGLHQPYSLRGYRGDSIDIHANRKGLPHLLIEVRQDLIGDEQGIAEMAALLTRIFSRLPDCKF